MSETRTHLLVADDDPSLRRVLTVALRRAGHEVTACASGDEAVALLACQRFDAVVTDLHMPGCSGLEVLRSARQARPDLPVIIVSGCNDAGEAVSALKEGASDYVVKPYDLDDLEARLGRVLAASSRPSASPAREGLIAASAAMRRVLSLAENVAASRATVLVVGESGTGKERVARFLHDTSSRAGGPFVAVNCAAIPENLLESELFGHERGAFSGADRRRIGKFEAASGGTLLLDEIGEMDLDLQPKLLRVLQEFEVDRVGGNGPVQVDVRVICTTNRDLRELVEAGRFREDLYYRIHVFPLRLPPLRERPEDIPELAHHFVARSFRTNRRAPGRITDRALDALLCHSWPGNVRELENVVERAVLLCAGSEVDLEHLVSLGGRHLASRPRPPAAHARPAGDTCPTVRFSLGTSLAEMERRLILETLQATGGNRTHTSRLLGISIRTLRNRLRDYRQAGIAVAPPAVGA